MKTVGEILKNKRLEKNLSWGEVEKATKIRLRYLEALEKNDFAKILGGASITKGFIKNYAEFLGLSSVDLLAIFRRDFRESKTGQIIPRGMVEPLSGGEFIWTPKITVVLALMILFLILGGYLSYQYSSSFLPPRLSVLSPKEDEITHQNFLEVKGKTDPDATLFLNQEMKILASDGSFTEKIFLSEGENEVTVEVVNRKGKKSKIVRQVQYEP